MQGEDLDGMLQGEALDRAKIQAPGSRKEHCMRRAGKETKGTVPTKGHYSWMPSEVLLRNQINTKVWLCQNNLHFPKVYSPMRTKPVLYSCSTVTQLTFDIAHSNYQNFSIHISTKIFRIIQSSFEKNLKKL